MLGDQNSPKHSDRQASVGISAQDVTVTYRNGHTALWNASFEVPRGTVTALVGVNGSGKSTLFKAIMGLCSRREGHDQNSWFGCERSVGQEPRGLCSTIRRGRLGLSGAG